MLHIFSEYIQSSVDFLRLVSKVITTEEYVQIVSVTENWHLNLGANSQKTILFWQNHSNFLETENKLLHLTIELFSAVKNFHKFTI